MTSSLYFLTTEQVHLLRAALCPPDEALAHWQAWRRMRNLHGERVTDEQIKRALDLLGSDQQRLLPFIYRNLAASGDALMWQLQETHETALSRNRRWLAVMHTALDALRQAKVESLLLGGVPLSIAHYKDMGARSMRDLALLVPKDRADRALAALRQRQLLPSAVGFRHRRRLPSVLLTNGEGVKLWLHWNAFPQHCYAGADNRFWADAQSVNFPDGLAAQTLSPTHLLFHTLVCGYHGGRRAGFVSIPDSVQLIRSQRICWDELLDLAERFTFRIPLQKGLKALQMHADLVLPPMIAQRLRQMVPTVTEQRYFDLLGTIPAHSLGQRLLNFRCSRLAFQLFRQDSSRPSLSSYLWNCLTPRLIWPEGELTM